MTKDEILKAFYLSQIEELAPRANLAALDFIYRILIEEAQHTPTIKTLTK